MCKKTAILFLFVAMFNLFLSINCFCNVGFLTHQIVRADQTENLPQSYCMRDEYYLPTPNQQNQGSCWAFASTNVFTTAVMKSTNQYIDYSEGWVSTRYADISNNLPGGAGSIYNFNGVTRDFGGILQEQDFNYEESYQVSKQNTSEMVDFYSQYLDRITPKNYRHTKFDVSSSDTNEYRNTIKSHILNESGLYVSCHLSVLNTTISGKTFYYRNPTDSAETNHALAIIGWDDNFSVQYNNTTYNGAWITLNDYGTNDNNSNGGIIYLLYQDAYVDEFVGYTYEEQLDDLYFYNVLSSSSSTFQPDLKGCCTNNFNVVQNQTKQKNVFSSSDNVSLTYSYKLSDNTNIDDIVIYYFQIDVSSKFNIVLYPNRNTITITAKESLELGAYKIMFKYSNNSNNEYVCGAFYIIDGTETECIKLDLSNASANDKNIKIQGVNLSGTGSNHLVYSTQHASNTATFKVYMSTYSSVKQLKVKNMSTLSEDATQITDPSKYQSITFTQTYQNPHYQLTIISKNSSKVYDVYFLSFSTTNTKFVTRINYGLNGGQNSAENHKVITTTDSLTVINNPTKAGCEFEGWYYSKDFNEDSKLTLNNNKYYLNHDNLIHYATNNTYWYSSSSDLDFNSYNIYAKWTPLETASNITIDNSVIDNNTPIINTGVTIDVAIAIGIISTIMFIIIYVAFGSIRKKRI